MPEDVKIRQEKILLRAAAQAMLFAADTSRGGWSIFMWVGSSFEAQKLLCVLYSFVKLWLRLGDCEMTCDFSNGESGFC